MTRPVSPLLPLIAASILTRVYLAYATPVIAWDGIGYIWGLVERAWNQAAEFIFLEVELAPDVIEKLNGVPEVGAVKSWKGHGGKDYTLIQLRCMGNTK